MRQLIPKLVDVKELSEMLSVKCSTIYRWVHENRIPHYKLYKLVRFDPKEVIEWLRKCKREKSSGGFGPF